MDESLPVTTKVSLETGQEIKINDHVYCSPPWAVRDGTPYSVARVMEFLRPENVQGPDIDSYEFTRVRLGWYYRPSDVSDRAVNDSRLLLAAIYSEVCDINHIRAKCYVVHRDRISDLAGWKKRPDRFYFNRLFDPYIKREFEIIQSSDARNLPDEVRDNLVDKYEYIVAEKEVVPDLTDSVRNCDACQKWCSAAESVRCDGCKNFFHMGCVTPPLLAKPSRGYGWTCAPCSVEHEEAVTTQQQVRQLTPSPAKPKSNAPAIRGRGRPRKDRNLAEKEESLVVKHFRGWPFRYVGQYTEAYDTLDDEDLIFPRAPARIGPKFQTVIAEPNTPLLEEERGGDNTVEVLSCIQILTESEVAEVELVRQRLTDDTQLQTSVDWLTEAIRRFSEAALAAKSFNTVSMKSPMRMELWKSHQTRYTDKEWTREEVAAFEDGLQLHGAELRAVREEVRTRSVYEVVRFYAHWKNERLKEENDGYRQHGPPKHAYKQYDNPEKHYQMVGIPDDQQSIYHVAPSKSPSCGACRTRECKVWYKAPKGLATNFLCDVCGLNWRKYADLNVRPLREESVSSMRGRLDRDKREGTPLLGSSSKRGMDLQATPPPTNGTPSTQLRCMSCLSFGPPGKVLKCKKCQFRVHAGIVGAAVDPANVDSWLCDICQNTEALEAAVVPECLLCPRIRPRPRSEFPGPLPDSYLRACKPTEGQQWVHVVCALFSPELTFTDSATLKLVEGVSTINAHRWSGICHLCPNVGGAVIKCDSCPKEFHVSCAWNHGYKMGFEIQPVKSSRRDTTITTTFRGETGCMTPAISCKDHDTRHRMLYDPCDTNDNGETVLQVYCRAYKQVAVETAHALLRKAKRMDQVLNIKSEGSTPPPMNPVFSVTTATGHGTSGGDPKCSQCHTEFSPAFYPIGTQLLCHRCHHEKGYAAGTMQNGNGNGADAMDVDPPSGRHVNGVNGLANGAPMIYV